MEERKLPHGWVVIAIVVLGLVVYGAYHLAITADTLLKPAVAPVPERMGAKPPPPKPSPQVPVGANSQPTGAQPSANATQPAIAAPSPAPADNTQTAPP